MYNYAMTSVKYLGVDYGSKRVGLSITDDTGNMAFPHSVLPNDKNLINAIKSIVEKEKVGEIVVGESHNYQGEPNAIMQEIEKFVESLKKEINVRVSFEPEFLSSLQAEKTQPNATMLDASAAAIILQSFIDKRKNSVI